MESIAQKQRDLIDNDLLEQDPEVMPGFYQGDMAGVYYDDEVRTTTSIVCDKPCTECSFWKLFR